MTQQNPPADSSLEAQAPQAEPVWTTAKGEAIKYPDLADDHLKNIIKDGYRNKHIFEEAKKRGFDVPVRPVDKISPLEILTYIEAIASTALSGNELASALLEMWNKEDKTQFYFHFNRMLEAEEDGKEQPKKSVLILPGQNL